MDTGVGPSSLGLATWLGTGGRLPERLRAAGVTPKEVTLLHTPGHTLGSMSLLITSEAERAIIVGDTIAHPAQVEHPEWGSAFDFDGETPVLTRSQLLDRIEVEGLTVTACHFPESGFGRVARLEGRRYWQALESRQPLTGDRGHDVWPRSPSRPGGSSPDA